MKKIKKLLAILMVACMAAGCGAFAFAEEASENVSETEAAVIESEAAVSLMVTVPALTNVSGVSTLSGNLLSWDAASGATAYRILVRRSDGVQKTLAVVSASETSYLDKDADIEKSTTYWICAKIGKTNGVYKKLTVSKITRPAMATGVTSKKSFTYTKTNLKWTNVVSWDEAPSAVAGYAIYRKVGDGTYQFVTVTARTKWTDSNPPQSENVFYRVYPYTKDAYGKKVLAKGATSVAVKPYKCAKVVKEGFTAESTEDGAVLTWSAVSKANGYRIYKRTGTEGSYKYAGKTTSGMTTWTDKDVSCDMYEYYKVYPYYINSDGKTVVNIDSTSVYVRCKHHYAAATYRDPKKCTQCGATVGSKITNKILIIGDSRSKNMALYGGAQARDFIWITESGVPISIITAYESNGTAVMTENLGVTWPESVINTLTNQTTATVDILSAIKAQGITDVVYALGVNSLFSEAQYQEEYQLAIETLRILEKYTDCKIYFMNALPVDESKTSVTNARVNSYNATIKNAIAGTSIEYIDANSQMRIADITDGLHYTVSATLELLDFLHNKFF